MSPEAISQIPLLTNVLNVYLFLCIYKKQVFKTIHVKNQSIQNWTYVSKTSKQKNIPSLFPSKTHPH